jgi:predicted PurR-regulated permease PerM
LGARRKLLFPLGRGSAAEHAATVAAQAATPQATGTAAAAPPGAVPAAARRARLSAASALWILAVLAVVGALYVGRLFFVPLLISVLASYALNPAVNALEKIYLPRSLAAAVVLVALTTAAGWAVLSLRGDAQSFFDKLPDTARRVRQSVTVAPGESPSPLQQIRRASQELQRAAAEATGARPPSADARPDDLLPLTTLRDFTLGQSASLMLAFIGEAPVVLLLTYFLLASGDHFRRKLMTVAGPSLSRRRVTLAILTEIDRQVQRYMLATLASNVTAGLGIWGGFALLGIHNAALWGAAAGVLHFIPYLGPALVTVGAVAAAFVQLGSLADAAGTAALALAVFCVSGMLLMPWLQSRFSRINAAVLFIALVFFGWLWGVWGLLLGAPLAAVLKVISDHVAPLKPVGELMGQ